MPNPETPNNVVRQARRINGKSVIHRRDFHFSRRMIHDRMIGAMVALMHFLGAAAKGQPKHLMAKANAEYRDAGVNDRPDRLNGIFAGRSRISRPV